MDFIDCNAPICKHIYSTINTGNVKDQTGTFYLVLIYVRWYNKRAVTDFDGNYSIDNVENGTIISATYMGLKNFSQSIAVQGLDILLLILLWLKMHNL